MPTFKIGEVAGLKCAPASAMFFRRYEGTDVKVVGELGWHPSLTSSFEADISYGYQVVSLVDGYPMICLPSELKKKAPDTGESLIREMFLKLPKKDVVPA